MGTLKGARNGGKTVAVLCQDSTVKPINDSTRCVSQYHLEYIQITITLNPQFFYVNSV